MYLPQVPQQRESKEYWSRNSLTVVTARVFYVVSGFFYFHPQCQGRRHLVFIASTGERSRVRWRAAPMLYTSATLCTFSITTVFAISNLRLIELASNRANYKDTSVSSKSVNQPWHDYRANIYIFCFVIIGCQIIVISNKMPLGLIAPPFKISLLAT